MSQKTPPDEEDVLMSQFIGNTEAQTDQQSNQTQKPIQITNLLRISLQLKCININQMTTHINSININQMK
jgi:hypothetical protein